MKQINDKILYHLVYIGANYVLVMFSTMMAVVMVNAVTSSNYKIDASIAALLLIITIIHTTMYRAVKFVIKRLVEHKVLEEEKD